MDPKAKNTLTTGLLYENRKFYDVIYFPKDKTNTINFWRNSFLYGRLNQDTESIVIKLENLEVVPDATDNFYVNKIVSLAYKEFITEYKKADLIKIIPKSNLNPLKVKKTLIEPNKQYEDNLNQLLDIVINSNKNLFNNNICSLQEFINNISSLLLTTNAILTKSKFITSNVCSISSTGLSIEFSNNEHGDDTKKTSKYINDQNFTFFMNTAEKYSFFIDKNAPWRIVFNLNTSYALTKIKELGYNDLQDYLDNAFDKNYITDYQTIKKIITEKYNSLYLKKSKTQIYSFSHEEQKILFDTKFKNEASQLDDLIWIKLWYFFRVCEENLNMTQQQFDLNLNKITKLYNIDKQKCLKWIEQETNPFLDGGKNPSYTQFVSVNKSKSANSPTFLFRI